MNPLGGRVKILLFLFLIFGSIGAIFLADYSYAFRNPTAAPPSGGAVFNIDASAPNNSISVGATGAITGGVWQGTPVGISYGGTGSTTATAALNALLPSQTGQLGKLLSTDGSNVSWAASSTGVVSVSCSSPLSCAGTNPANFSIQQATSVASGYLSSTDWNTFNNKLSTSGTAANSDLLDGLDSSAFLSTSSDYGRSGVTATLYESTTPLSSKYLGISAKAADANLLDGLDSTSFLNTSNDYGRSGVSATLYEGSTALSSKYVQKSGDTMTGTLYTPNMFDSNNSTYYIDPSYTGYSLYLAGSMGAYGTYYDLSNTSYYVKPSGTTVLNSLCLSGTCRTTWPSGGGTLGCVTYYTCRDTPYGIWEGYIQNSPSCSAGYLVTGCGGGSNGIDIESLSWDVYDTYCQVSGVVMGGGTTCDIDSTVRCCRVQ